ncbi:MAG: HipA domain-containing protein [Deltaproteobacteria bacterium]|nr:HipA domain-containing protein [Deltaproteobacteria bacterium]
MTIGAPSEDLMIRRVRSTGEVDVLGWWRPRTKTLELERAGFPLLGPGTHVVEGDHPWVFEDMAPDGYLATQFARWFPELGLPPKRDLWAASDVLRVLTTYGNDLPGNLLIGDESLERFREQRKLPPLDLVQLRTHHYPRFVAMALSERAGSSVGGARPKLVVDVGDGTGLIVKFSPPLSTAPGRRWASLLRMEALASNVLGASTISAVRAASWSIGGREYLEVERFDRLLGGGRRGHVTLYNLGIALFETYADPEPVIDGLVRAGHLSATDARIFARIHAFSHAIGNDDTHLGNYGLIIDDNGRASLAPAYDVLPMAFAPKHDELPDDRVGPFAKPADAPTQELVRHYAELVDADTDLDPDFKKLWRSKLTWL